MRIIASTFFAAAITALSFAQTPTLQPGQYELVSEISLTGRADKMPPRKDLHCYTPQDVAELAKSIGGRGKSSDCKILKSSVVGSTMTYTTECAMGDNGRLNLSGEVQFTSPASYHAVVTMIQTSGRGSNPM